VSMPVVMMKKKVADNVKQHTHTAKNDEVRLEPVANPQTNEDEQCGIKGIEDVLPLRKEITLSLDLLLRMLEEKRLNSPKYEHWKVRQYRPDERVAMKMRFCLPT